MTGDPYTTHTPNLEIQRRVAVHIGKYDWRSLRGKSDCYEDGPQMVWTCGESEGNPRKHNHAW